MPKVTVIKLPEELLHIPEKVAKAKGGGFVVKRLVTYLGRYAALLLHRDNLVIYLMAFLLGRVSVLGEVTAIGLAFFAAVAQVAKEKAVGVGFWAVTGLVTAGFYWDAGVYVVAIILYCYWADDITRLHKKMLAIPLFMFCAVLFGGFIGLMVFHATLYNWVLVFFNASICMILSCIFSYGVPVLMQGKRSNITSENITCLIVLLALAIVGLGNVSLADYSLRTIISGLLVMILAYSGKAGMGAAAGVAVGLVTGLDEGAALLVVASYAVSGMMAGVFRGLGKFAVILGFLLGNVLMTLYFGQVDDLTRGLREGAVAAVLFAAVPVKLLLTWQKRLEGKEEVVVNDSTMIRQTTAKIRHIAEMFRDLAFTFSSIEAKAGEQMQEDDLARALRTVGERVCENCEKRRACWENDFYRTYQAMLELLEKADAGKLQGHSAPKVLQDNCLRLQAVMDNINSVSQFNQAQQRWKKRVIEQKQMVTEQMKATSTIVENLAYELGREEMVDREMSRVLQEKALLLDCPLTSVSITGDAATLEIAACKQPCHNKQECRNTILPLAANVLQEKLVLRAECGNNLKKQPCRLTMHIAKRFIVETGIAAKPKAGQTVSGDTCKVIPLSKEKIVMVLSDGMGSGTQAASESTMAIRFLERMLSVGFAVDVAVKTVNSMLMLRAPDESFATVDMAVIDTFSGNTKFLKIGAAPSFIKRVREVGAIKSSSLPIGILPQIEVEPVHATLVAGDLLVMVSDGVADITIKGKEKESWLINYLRRTLTIQPQQLAEEILAQAVILSANQVSDDMTVMVAKITEKPDRI